MNQDLVMRHEKVAYCKIPPSGGGAAVIKRMTGFTSFGTNRNPEEYTRKYVDEAHQTTDITSYDTSISFAFDLFADNPVHQYLADIIENEKLGADAIVDIYVVDFSKPVTGVADTYECAHRQMVVVPSSDGDDANVYTYSGDLRTKGDRTIGQGTLTDNEQTLSYA